MSMWTYLSGTITVEPMGRTQPEKRYILETVLGHLPLVTGSEGDMDVYIVQKNGHSSYSSHDEFGCYSDKRKYKPNENGIHKYGTRYTQDEYILVVDGSFRNREFEETFKEFNKWLNRLAKRVIVNDVLVNLQGYDKNYLFENDNDVYSAMHEDCSWVSSNEAPEINWCEYLMWDNAKNADYPAMLAYKYFKDEDNDKEIERRLAY